MRNTKDNIRFDIYANYRLVVIVTDDVKQTHDELIKTYKLKHDGEHTRAFCAHFSSGATIMVIPHDVEPSEIAHEAVHVVQALWKHIGVLVEDSEITAYHVEFVVNKVIKSQNKWRKQWIKTNVSLPSTTKSADK